MLVNTDADKLDEILTSNFKSPDAPAPTSLIMAVTWLVEALSASRLASATPMQEIS